MRLLTTPAAAVVAAIAVLGLPVPERVSDVSDPPGVTVESWSGLTRVRVMELDKLGFSGPTGLDWSERLGALVATESSKGRSRITAFTGDENLVGRVRLPRGAGAGGVAVDPGTGRATVASPTGSLSVGSAALRRSSQRFRSSGLKSVPDPDGLTYDRGGELVALDDGYLVRLGSAGGVERARVAVPAGHQLRGLTTHPQRPELFTLDLTAHQLLALDDDGDVLTRYAADEVDLIDVQDIAFAPSGDPTDHPSVQRLFIADAGKPGATGIVMETTLEQYGLAASYTISAADVREVDTSAYNPSSPDPSGVAYLPGADRLFIADGEVDEMGIFRNVNLYTTTRAGTLQNTGVSLPWSAEPVGVGYNPVNNHLFVSDDDYKTVFELTTGGDGRFGTSDDGITSWDVEGRGIRDPEGIDYDVATNSLWFAGGEAADFHRQQAGSDGQFGTSDDVYTHWNAGIYGLRDPEGLAFDQERGTALILDDGTQTIYEVDRNGALLNTIDISVAASDAAAGLALGPSTSGTGRSFYMVARGVDNNSDPDENDGILYEIKSPLPGGGGVPGNFAPIVNAGSDRSVILPDTVTMAATVSDDGQPVPPGAVSLAWSVVSGPGAVTFSPSAGVEDPTVSFGSAGSYVLRLTADDGAALGADDVVVQVAPVGGALVTEVRVAAGSDDAEQGVASGSVALTSSDLELGADGNTAQVVGVRFGGVQVPKNATILSAYVQFRADEVSTGVASLSVRAEDVDSAPTYTAASGNLSSRVKTAASVAWPAADWPTIGEAGVAQRTPNLGALVQAVVNRAGWVQGNAMAFQVTGTGRRTAEPFEGGATFAPLLHIEYSTGSGGPTNQAPTASAGGDQTITLPATASLDGTVGDDGLPSGTLTSAWSQVSGPGTASFGNPSATDTTASFSAAGSYVLRLTASDGALSTQDDVTVTVNPAPPGNAAPVVDAGTDQQITLPATATMAATVTDDGMPVPPGAVSLAWSVVSGPGTASFSDATAEDPVVTFPVAGSYVLRLTADDGAALGADDVVVQVAPVGGALVTEVRVAAGSDDAEQGVASGSVALTSSDLELGADGNTAQVVGVRFGGVQVPKNATILSAYVQFRADEVSTGVASLSVRAEDVDSAPTYTAASGNLSSRVKTAASVAWPAADWPTIGEAGVAQRTPNLGALVQAVVNRAGWVQGNAMAFQVTGTGRRTAEPFEGGATFAPLLHIEYSTGSGGPTNQAPTASAGGDQTITLPATASLDGTVGDDGLPSGTLTSAWSQVSGPGTASFGNPSATDTTASFSAAGSYVLRLTASDGALSTQDDVTVTVNPAPPGNAAPVVDAGTDQQITLPATATMAATVTDDGLPELGVLTLLWETLSGPATASFSDAAAEDPVVTFPVAGSYVLRLTANDGQQSASDTVAVTVLPVGGGTPQTLEKRVTAGSDDAEQSVRSLKTALTSDDLELSTDGNTVQLIGVRFTGLSIPQGATITRAYVQFRVDAVSTAAASLTVRAEAADNTPTYVSTSNNVGSRTVTGVSVPWVPMPWDVVGASGEAQRTPDLTALVQAVVSRPGWVSGNAMAFQITGTGLRKAVAFEGGAGFAPLLHLEFTS